MSVVRDPSALSAVRQPAAEDDVRSVAIIRALALGDMLCAVPSLRALRHRYAGAHITLVGLPWALVLLERFPAYLDEHVEFPGFPGIPEVLVDPARTVSFLSEMQAHRFDLVVQLHGNGLSINAFAALLGGRRTAGFVPVGLAELADPPDGLWVPYPAHGSEIHRLLALPAALGAPVDDRLEFPLTNADRAELAEAVRAEPLAGGAYAVVHPGASTPVRRWPPERFAAVADVLVEEGLRVVLTGTAEEAPVTTAVTRAMAAPAIDLAGRTSLGALAALVDGARILVANDTGVSHLAAAVATPSVIVSSGSDPERWAPLDGERHRVLGGRPGAGRCRHDGDGVHRCVGDACTLEERGHGPARPPDVTVDEVIAAVSVVLDRPVAVR